MYENHWSLERRPFGSGCDSRFYYPSDAHQGTLLKLRFAVESKHAAALVIGESGTGKTLIGRLLAERLPLECAPLVHLTFPQMPAANLLAYLARELQAEHNGGAQVPSIDEAVWALQQLLTANARTGKHAVIIIDEAHLIESTQTFEALRLLSNIEFDGSPVATMIFIGKPALMPIFERLPQWEQRFAVKCLLRPLGSDETHAYVQHRLQTAGAGDERIFEIEALEALHAITQGTPRDVNRIADLALLTAFADGETTIAPERIHAVASELVNVGAD
ncbi:MAG: AAA family ATPase [Planctomycetia bacterium]|nr:AAA family ATPase [Planctomycetia bacterium]